ncbi:MAG: carboxylesterase [Acidimicrobiales bacterium]|nr:MAG: carboxylesterase [Acidimicrobiales bacterium]
MLHGWGATERDVLPIGALLDQEGSFYVVGARAPHPTVSSQHEGACWFEAAASGVDASTFLDSLRMLQHTVENLSRAYGVPPERVVAVGFSQGGAMALALAYAPGGPKIGGVACLSGFFPDVDGVEFDWEHRSDIPAFVQHGSEDGRVPMELAESTVEFLRSAGVRVVFDVRPMAHQMTLEGLRTLQSWIADLKAGRVGP